MQHILITTDLHQHRTKWEKLVKTAADERPAFILIAGDILPKYDGLVFCGMNKVRDFPFGYKHYCVPDEDWVVDPVQFFRQGLTFDASGNEIAIPDLRQYLMGKRSILERLQDLKAQLAPGEMARSIWMVHQPPALLGMDICGSGQKVGSPALLHFIEQNQPLLGCSGHIHESPHQRDGRWMANVGNTTWIQPGQVDDRLHYVALDITDAYAVANVQHSVFGRHGKG